MQRLIKTKRNRQIVFIWVLLAPALAIYIFYRVIPLIWNLVLSFSFWSPGKKIEYAGLYHYEEMLLYDSTFWTALKNTGMFLLATPIAIVIGLGLALLVDQKIIGRGLYRTIIFLPYPMMVVAVGIIWRWLYNDQVGFINYMLISSGLISTPIPFLEQFATALPAVIAAAIWQITGFFMIILLTGLQNIPEHLYDVARIDGARAHHRFFRITLPLIRPSIFLCVILGVIASFTSFDLIYTMTGGGPGRATELLVTYIYKSAFTLSQFDYAGAMTVVMFALLLLLALIANRLAGGDTGRVDMGD